MSDPGAFLAGYLARTSAVGLVAVAIVAILERMRRPEAAAMAARAGLICLLLAAGLAAVPWPDRYRLALPARPEARAARPGARSPGVPIPEARPTARAIPSPDPTPGRPRPVAPVGLAPSARRPAGLPARPARPRPAAPDPAPGLEAARPKEVAAARPSTPWSTWFGAAILAGWALGLARMASGLIALRRCVDRGELVEDPVLLAVAGEIRAALGLARRVAILESDAGGLPATLGWLRPCVLLPRGWRGWTNGEVRVVLAHELAHVHRGDFAGRLAGQLALIVHFYHPIAHWLAGRLRLHQELAADAWGIRLAGGRATYLTTLARMALRHDAGWANAGPGRPRLAFDGSLLRRMDMISSDLALGQSPDPNPWRARWLTCGLLGLALVLATALRGPRTTAADGTPPEARPLAAKPDPQPGGGAPFDLSLVPADAVGIVALRPSSILEQEDLRSLMARARLDGGFREVLARAERIGIAPDSIEQVAYFQLKPDLVALKDEADLLKHGALIVKSRTPIDPKAAEEALKGLKLGFAPSLRTPDPHTVIIGEEATLRYVLDHAPGPRPKYAWAEAWAGVERCQVAMAFDAAYARSLVEPFLVGDGPTEVMLMASPLAPIWEGAKGVSLGFDLDGDEVGIVSINHAATEPAAENTLKTVQAIMTLSGNAARSARRTVRNAALLQKNALEFLVIAKLADVWTRQSLERMQVERAGNSVRFRAKLDTDTLLILSKIY